MLNVCEYVPLVTVSGNPVNVGTVVATPALLGGAAQQWMCEAVVPVVKPLNVTSTLIRFVVVSQVTNAVPVPAEVGWGGFSFKGLRPGAFGPVATNSNSARAVIVMLVVAAAFLPDALSVAGSLTPDAVGAYRSVTTHDLSGPRLVPVQPSDVTVNVAGPDNDTVNAAVAEPPVFISVNVCDWTSPTPTVPKSKVPLVAGAQLIDGGRSAFPAATDTDNTNAAAAAAAMMTLTSTRITHPLITTSLVSLCEVLR
jgi:hypothetical protein